MIKGVNLPYARPPVLFVPTVARNQSQSRVTGHSGAPRVTSGHRRAVSSTRLIITLVARLTVVLHLFSLRFYCFFLIREATPPPKVMTFYNGAEGEVIEMASYLWRKYADYLYTKWEKTFLWDMVEPYRRPKSFTPLVTIYMAAFYSGVIGAAITEQLYKSSVKDWGFGQKKFSLGPRKPYSFTQFRRGTSEWREKYWEEHPGKAVPLMRPKFYGGPWRVMGGNEPPSE
ncbi:Uncharacterized protein HKD37_08G023826 [Glycine soja]